MYEICALMASKKTPKARAPRKPSIKIGAAIMVWGRPGVVVGRSTKHANWWDVEIEGKGVVGFDRSQIDVVA
jgi:hypothetical protein